MTNRPFTFTSLALAALLTACGGGGDSSSDTTTITVPVTERLVGPSWGGRITTDNYVELSAPLIRAVASATASSGLVTGAAVQRERAAAASSTAAVAASPLQLTRLASQLIGTAPLRERPQAATPTDIDCLAGSGTVSADDADNNGKVSAGDVISFTGDACVLAEGMPAISGTFSMQMEAVALGSNNMPTGFQVLVSTTDFGAGGYGTMTGQSRLWASGLTGNSPVMRISHIDTVVNQAGLSVPYLFDVYAIFSGSVITYEISGGIAVGGNTYMIQRLDPFVASPPTSGALRMVDIAGNSATLTALSSGTSFTMQYALSGTTGAGQPSFTGSWRNYSSNGF